MQHSPSFNPDESLPAPTPQEAEQQSTAGQPEHSRNWLRAVGHGGRMAVLVATLSPANELARAALFGTAEALSDRNVFISGGTAGLSTFIIEGAGGLAAAGVFGTERSKQAFQALNAKAKKVGIPVDRKLSPAAKTWWTFMAGTPVGMALEEREDPTRTKEQNRRYTLQTASWQAGALALIGAGVAEGINVSVENPVTAGVAGGVIATGVGVATFIKKRYATIKARVSQKQNKQGEENE